MHILATDDVPHRVLQEFSDGLRGEIDVEAPKSRVVLLSAQPPSWITLIGSVEWWQVVLAGYVSIYAAEITKEAAKATWRIASTAVSEAAKKGSKLRTLAASLFELRSKLAARTSITVSIPQPSEYFGAKLTLSVESPESVEMQLALFIIHLPALVALANSHESENALPATGYFLELLDDGALHVAWADGKTLQSNETTLVLPAGEA